MNFPDILITTCDKRLSIPLSAFGIDLTLLLQWTDTSLDTLHLLLEPQLYPTSMCGANCKSSVSVSVSKIPASDKIRSTSFSGSENLQIRK